MVTDQNDKIKSSPFLLLISILLSVLIVPTAVSGSGVALPSIASSMDSTPQTLQWVVNSFNLTFASFSLIAGSFFDQIGHKKGFMTGLLIFLVASILSAFSPDIIILDFARGLAGVGAATIFACAGALLVHNFEGVKRMKAFALFGSAAGVGLGLGPTISGMTITLVGWSGLFLVNSFVILIALAIVLLSRTKNQKNENKQSIDYFGAILFGCALLILITGIVQGNQWGWDSNYTLSCFIIGTILFLSFFFWEKKFTNPLLDFSLLKNQVLVGYLLVPIAGAIGYVTLLTYFPIYTIVVKSMTIQNIGFLMMLMTGPVIVAPVIAGKLVNRGIADYYILVFSVFLYVLGSTLLLFISPSSSMVLICISLIILGFGFGLGVGLVDGRAISTVPQDKAGMVSGLVSTIRLGSEAIAVASYASILAIFIKQNSRTVFSQYADTISSYIASGNVSLIKQFGATLEQATIIYHLSFQHNLWFILLFSICLLLCISILIKPRSYQIKK